MSSQHGFTKSKSCSTNLISPCDKVTVYADKGSTVNAMYIDFWKAFERLTQHSDLKAEEAFQLTSKNSELSDSRDSSGITNNIHRHGIFCPI